MPSPAALSRLLVAVLPSALPQVGCSDEAPVPSGDRPVLLEESGQLLTTLSVS